MNRAHLFAMPVVAVTLLSGSRDAAAQFVCPQNGQTQNGECFFGDSTSGTDAQFTSYDATSGVVTATDLGTGTALAALTSGGTAVSAIDQGSTGYGVYASGAIGVYGISSTAAGVAGHSSASSTAGVAGYATGSGSSGVYGECTSGTGCATGGGHAGFFRGNVDITGTLSCGSGCNSDARLKKNIEPLTGALDKLLQLRGVNFEWKNPEEHENHTGTQTGVIAQDVQKVFPQWVRETEKGVLNVDVEARTMTALTVESFRTLKAENDALKARIDALENGRRPVVSGINLNGVGFGIAGLAMAGAIIVVGRRKKDEERA